jgi:hypothetical protein
MSERVPAVETYEYIRSSASNRTNFLSGNSTHLDLGGLSDYPKFPDGIIRHVDNEGKTFTSSRFMPGLLRNKDFVGGVSESFKAAQHFYLQQAANVIFHENDMSEYEQAAQINHLRRLGEELYGVPDPSYIAMMKTGLMSKISSKDFPEGSETSCLRSELEHGFVFEGQDGISVDVRPVFLEGQEDNSEEFPALSEKARQALGNYLQPLSDIVDRVVQGVDPESPVPRGVGFEWMKQAAALLKAEQGIDIAVEQDFTASSCAWNSERNCVLVGMLQSEWKDLASFKRSLSHEFCHGIRSARGKTNPNKEHLGYGVYSITGDGFAAGYLDFEEGLMSVVEKVFVGEDVEWGMQAFSYYLTIGLLYEERTPREVFEIIRRIRILSTVKSGTESPPDKTVVASGNNTIAALERVCKGMPMRNPIHKSGKGVFYNKDLCYFSGKIKAVNYINHLAETLDGDELIVAIDRLFMGKIDNTVPDHLEYAEIN